MRNVFNFLTTSMMALAILASPVEIGAQTRATRSSQNNSSSQQRSSSSNSSSSSSRSSSSSTRSNNSSSTRSSSSSASRQSSSSSANRQSATSSANRQSATSSANRQSSASTTPQVNRNSRTEASQQNNQSRSSSSTSASRQSSASASRQSATSSANRQSSSSSASRQSSAAAARQSASSSKGLNSVGSGRTSAPRENNSLNMSAQNLNNIKMDDKRNISRVAPVQRERIDYNHPEHFFNPGPHYFGYGVHSLPPHYSHMRHWGVDYYFYNDIYYRKHGSIYVVCRPPFGVTFSRSLRRMKFATVRFAYYYNAYHTLNVIDDNYRTIYEQNRIIAENNARIASQNSTIALNSNMANSAYNIANALGLVQSYAGLDDEYFYEDGVFYTINKRGRYEVIVPPAGALVDELPDDYDVIVLNGIEYYRVDDTVYRLTLVDGTPLLEVLGQMPYQMASRYWN